MPRSRWRAIGPGDPVRVAAGNFRDEEAFARIRAARGLDKPIYEQYYIYMKDVITTLDFGESFRYQGVSVNEVLFPAMWRSLPVQHRCAGDHDARLASRWAYSPLDGRAPGRTRRPSAPFSVIQSVPALISVPFLLLFFALKLGILPASGWPQDCNVSCGFLGDSYECIGVISKEAMIPLLALSLPGIAVWGRFTRAFTLEVMKEDYVRTARSKGLSEFTVMTRHVLRNAMLPLSTIVVFSLVGAARRLLLRRDADRHPGRRPPRLRGHSGP